MISTAPLAIEKPLADATIPFSRIALRGSGKPVHRFQTFYLPNGMAMEYWSPKGEGAAFELSPILEPLAAFRNQMLVLSGIKASFAATHVVADVTGYFTRFPVELFSNSQKSITVITEGGQVDLSAGACTQVSSCTIVAPAPGSVIVRAWAQIKLNHGTNVGGDRIAVGVKNTDPTNCTNNDQSINASDFEVPDANTAFRIAQRVLDEMAGE